MGTEKDVVPKELRGAMEELKRAAESSRYALMLATLKVKERARTELGLADPMCDPNVGFPLGRIFALLDELYLPALEGAWGASGAVDSLEEALEAACCESEDLLIQRVQDEELATFKRLERS